MAGQTYIQKIKVFLEGAGKASKDAKKVSQGMDKLAKSALKAGAAYFGAMGIINGLKASVELYKEQELAERQLQQALGKSSKGLETYAASLQRVTNFGDEYILQGMAQLAFFIKEEDQIKVATKAVLDLAAAKGMDLVAAADLVAKSVGSTTNALSRYGISADGAVGSSERLFSITDRIAELFGGQAIATTNTLSGKLDQMSNTIGDMQEKIGQALAPSIIKLAKGFGEAADGVASFLDSFLLTPMERTIKRMQELGKDTKEFERVVQEMAIRKLEVETKGFESRAELGEKEKKLIADLMKLNEDAFAAEEKGIKKGQKGRLDYVNTTQQDDYMTTLNNIDAKEGELDVINKQIALLQQLELEKQKLKILDQEIIEEEEDSTNRRSVFFEDYQNKVEDWATKNAKLTNQEIKDLNQQFAAEDKLENLREQQVNTAMAIGAAQVHAGQAAADAAGAYITAEIQSALATMIKKAFAEAGFFAGLGAVATAGATGSIMAQTIKSVTAAEGFEGIVDEPTLFLAGEEGAEYVDIEPTMNEGAGRGGANITITGNVLSRDFIEDEAVPMIREALRKGGDIGIG